MRVNDNGFAFFTLERLAILAFSRAFAHVVRYIIFLNAQPGRQLVRHDHYNLFRERPVMVDF